MSHVRYTNTQLIFREVQYTNFKFVPENANANQFQNHPYLLQTVLMETNVFWTSIVEKVVNVIRLVGKHMGDYLSYANRVLYRVAHMYLNGFRMPLGELGVMVCQFWKQILINIYFEHHFC